MVKEMNVIQQSGLGGLVFVVFLILGVIYLKWSPTISVIVAIILGALAWYFTRGKK